MVWGMKAIKSVIYKQCLKGAEVEDKFRKVN